MSIGNRILELRLSKNINLSTLMNLTGLSTDFLFDLENDLIPFTYEDLSKIASALGLNKNDIFSVWESDYYEDFHNAKDDEARLKILNQFGVPEDLLSDYLRLAFDSADNNPKQYTKPSPNGHTHTEPQRKTPFYKNGLFWTIVATIVGILQYLKE